MDIDCIFFPQKKVNMVGKLLLNPAEQKSLTSV